MVKILQKELDLIKVNKPTVNIHVQIKKMNLDMKVESLEHLSDILKYRHKELEENIVGKLVIRENDNKGT